MHLKIAKAMKRLSLENRLIVRLGTLAPLGINVSLSLVICGFWFGFYGCAIYNMGRKEASGQQSQPLDQYRKQIGKQDWKKSKKDVKSMKQKADESPEFTPQIVVLWIGVIIVALSSVYMLLVWYLGVDSLDSKMAA